jgi:tetracycline repressor-like protein
VLSHHMPSQGEIPFFPSLGLFRHVGEEYELYKALVWTPGIDLLIKHLQGALSHRIEQGFQESKIQYEVPIPIMASFIAGSFLTLLKWWLENKMVHSPEQMDEVFRKLTLTGIEDQEVKPFS